MKKFPGVIATVGKQHRLVLNEEQREWLRTWYPTIENPVLGKAMGIGRTRVGEFAREMGLVKSEDGMRAIQKRRAKVAAETNEKNGCFARKRGKPVSEATMAGVRRRWQRERDGLVENSLKRLRRENPKKYAEMVEKRRQTRRENARKEKMRVLYGLPRKTKMREVVLCPYKKSQNHHRHSAYQRGYVLAEDCSEGSPDRYVIFYDKDTQRSEKFEKNCIADGFQIREWT